MPYCTWLNTTPTSWGRPAPWSEIRDLNAARKVSLVGENTGGESLADAQTIFADAVTRGGFGLIWLDYSTLIGAGPVKLADLAALIKAHP